MTEFGSRGEVSGQKDGGVPSPGGKSLGSGAEPRNPGIAGNAKEGKYGSAVSGGGVRVVHGENVTIGGKQVKPGTEVFPSKSGTEGPTVVLSNTTIGQREVLGDTGTLDLREDKSTSVKDSTPKDKGSKKGGGRRDGGYDIGTMNISSAGVTIDGVRQGDQRREDSATPSDSRSTTSPKDGRRGNDDVTGFLPTDTGKQLSDQQVADVEMGLGLMDESRGSRNDGLKGEDPLWEKPGPDYSHVEVVPSQSDAVGRDGKVTDGKEPTGEEKLESPTEKPRIRVTPTVIHHDRPPEIVPEETPNLTFDNSGKTVDNEYDPTKGKTEATGEPQYANTSQGSVDLGNLTGEEINEVLDSEIRMAEARNGKIPGWEKAPPEAKTDQEMRGRGTPAHERRARTRRDAYSSRSDEISYNPSAEEIGTAKKLLMRIGRNNPVTMDGFTVEGYMQEITNETSRGRQLAKDFFEIKDTADAFRQKNPENPNPTVKDFTDYYKSILNSWKASKRPERDRRIAEIERRIRFLDDMSGGIINGYKPLSHVGL